MATVIPRSNDAVAINDRGWVVGTGEFGGYLWRNGIRTELGSLGGDWSNANDINERGQIVGIARRAGSYSHAFLWQDGSMRDLGTLGGQSEAVAINDRGEVIGESETENGNHLSFLWRNGKMIALPPRFDAMEINNRGQVVGEVVVRRWNGSRWREVSHRAMLWEDGTMRDLCAGGGPRYCSPSAVNDDGQVIVQGWDRQMSEDEMVTTYGNRAFLWEKGRLTDLGTLGGKQSWPVAINERGQIVGTSTTKTGREHSFLWQNGTMRDLGVVGEPALSFNTWGAVGINNRGQVVGEAWERPFVWQKGVLTRLPLRTLGCVFLSGCCELGTSMEPVNERGQIIGTCETGVLWTLKP